MAANSTRTPKRVRSGIKRRTKVAKAAVRKFRKKAGKKTIRTGPKKR